MLLDLAGVWDGVTGQEFDEGRFTGTVGTDDADAGREGDGARDFVERGFRSAGIGEGAVCHLEDRSRRGTDAHERAWRGEAELDDRGREGVVRLCGGMLLDKLCEVAAVVDEALLLVVDDVGADVVEETAVVRHDQDGGLGLSFQVAFEP